MGIQKETLLTDRLEIRLDADTHALLKNKADQQGVSIGALVRSAVSVVYREEPQRVNRSGRVLQRKILSVPPEAPILSLSPREHWNQCLPLKDIVDQLAERALSVCETYPNEAVAGGPVDFMRGIIQAISVEGRNNGSAMNTNIRSYSSAPSSNEPGNVWLSSLLASSLVPTVEQLGMDSVVNPENILTNSALNNDPGYSWDINDREDDGKPANPYRKLIIYDKDSQMSFTIYLRGKQLAAFIEMGDPEINSLVVDIKAKILLPVFKKATEIKLDKYLAKNSLTRDTFNEKLFEIMQQPKIFTIERLWAEFSKQVTSVMPLTNTMKEVVRERFESAIQLRQEPFKQKAKIWMTANFTHEWQTKISNEEIFEDVFRNLRLFISAWHDCTVCEENGQTIPEAIKQWRDVLFFGGNDNNPANHLGLSSMLIQGTNEEKQKAIFEFNTMLFLSQAIRYPRAVSFRSTEGEDSPQFMGYCLRFISMSAYEEAKRELVVYLRNRTQL